MEEEAIKLLKEFAEIAPVSYSGDMWHNCAICYASLVVKVEDHEPDCLWRRVKEFVEGLE